jgi:hypothetical protein
MAKTSKNNPTDGAAAVPEDPGQAPEPEPGGPEPEQSDPEPAASDRKEKPPADKNKLRTFFQNVDRIEPADWGPRATITVYRSEPVIDKLRSTENKYVTKYGEAIDLEKLKQDYGSGRYKLYLNFKKPAAKSSIQIDVLDVDILDMKYPPELALGDWVDDPKNKRWAWAKGILEKREAEKRKAEEEAAKRPEVGGMSAGQVLELVDDIEERVSKRYEQKAPVVEQKSAAADLTALVAAAKGIADLQKPAAAPVENPQLAQMQKQIEYQQKRADDLMAKLLDTLAAKSTAPSGFDTFKGVVKEIADFLPQVKSLLPNPSDVESASRMTGSQEFWQGIINTGIEKVSPLLTLFGNFMMTRAMQQAAAQPRTPPPPGSVQVPTALPQAQQFPATPPGAPPQAPSVDAQQPLTPIVEQVPPMPSAEQMTGMFQVIGQSVAAALLEGKDGSVYAENFEGLFGETAYDQLAALPKERLLQIFQSMPMWTQLGILQQKVPQFIDEFIDYGKPEAPGAPSADEGDEA